MDSLSSNHCPQTTNKSFWPIMLAIAIGNFTAVLCSTTVTIMLPVFMHQFNTTIIEVQWTLTGYMLASGIVAPMIGYLADRLSLKRTYLISMVGFLITVILAGFAWDIYSLITFRILQGCFGGMIMPLTMSLIYQVVPKEKQAFALSLWSVSGVLAPTFGPTVAGLVTDAFGWQWVFFMNIPFVLIAIVMAQHYLPFYKLGATTDGTKVKFDYQGLLSGMIGTYCLLFVFSNFSQWGFSLKSIAMLVLGTLCLVIFFRTEFRIKNPLLHLKVLCYPTFTWSIVIMTIASLCMNLSIVVLPIYLQDILSYSTTLAALVMLPGPMVIFFLVPILGKYYHRFNAKILLASFLSIGFVAMWMFKELSLTTTALFVVIAVVARDLGFASISMPATNVGMTVIPPEYTNHAAAVNSWVRQCVISFGIGLINTFLALRTLHYFNQMSLSDTLIKGSLEYNSCYVMAMSDLANVGFVLVIFAIFAVTRLKIDKSP